MQFHLDLEHHMGFLGSWGFKAELCMVSMPGVQACFL